MDFSLSDDQVLLDRSIDQVVLREIARAQSGRARDDVEAWEECATLGWLAVSLPSEAGGIGGAIEAMQVMQGFGRALLTAPLLPTVVLGAGLVGQLGTTDQLAWLPRVVAGDLKLAVALSEPPNGFDPIRCATRAIRKAGRYVLTGRKTVVLGAPEADVLLVPAAFEGSLGVFVVRPASEGLTLHPCRLADGRLAANLVLDQANADDLLGGGPADPSAIEHVADRAIVAICADAVGAMQEAIRLTVEYLKTRRQFGAALSSFQVLQHRVVDMQMELEHATSLMQVATMACDHADPLQRTRLVSAAKARTAKAARFVGEQSIQLHGGIGMTEEHPIGRYYKRLIADEKLFGDRDFHLDRLASCAA